MIEVINDRVTVAMVYSPDRGEPWPCIVIWKHKKRMVTERGLHILYKSGDKPIHVYQLVVDGHLQMKLSYDAWNLIWTLEEVSDGQTE